MLAFPVVSLYSIYENWLQSLSSVRVTDCNWHQTSWDRMHMNGERCDCFWSCEYVLRVYVIINCF